MRQAFLLTLMTLSFRNCHCSFADFRDEEFDVGLKIHESTWEHESSRFLADGLEKKHKEEQDASIQIEKELLKVVHSLPTSTEKRVIAFALYGTGHTRYTVGAIKNAEIVSTYFPGWVCRFYLTGPVDESVLKKLRDLKAEVVVSFANMFSRFVIASDPTVDRYIIRDVDSRLSCRDR
jgi:hypothetical protein